MIQNTEIDYKIQDSEYIIQITDYRINNIEYKIQNIEIQNTETILVSEYSSSFFAKGFLRSYSEISKNVLYKN